MPARNAAASCSRAAALYTRYPYVTLRYMLAAVARYVTLRCIVALVTRYVRYAVGKARQTAKALRRTLRVHAAVPPLAAT